MAAHRAPRRRPLRTLVRLPWRAMVGTLRLTRRTLVGTAKLSAALLWLTLAVGLLLVSLVAPGDQGGSLRTLVADAMLTPLVRWIRGIPETPPVAPPVETAEDVPAARRPALHVVDRDPALWPPMGQLDTPEDDPAEEGPGMRALRGLRSV